MKSEISELIMLVKKLQEEIALLKNSRKSNTSSTSSSHDFCRSNIKNSRIQSDRKVGGQKGHNGSTLKMSEKPDEIITYLPTFCNTCGELLEEKNAKLETRKQEIHIPPIKPVCTEHRSYSCICKKCGVKTISDLPIHLKGNIQYGASVVALVTYLSNRQYVSYERISEFMNDVLKLKISQGTIRNMLYDITKKAMPFYNKLASSIENSRVVGGDETGSKVNGLKAWIWTFQTKLITFLAISMSRGYDTVSYLFENGFPLSVYVTDCWAAQLKVKTKAKQICTAHLLRELSNFIDALKCEWSMSVKKLLKEAIELKKTLEDKDYCNENKDIIRIKNELDTLLKLDFNEKHKKVRAFIKRLIKNQSSILTFLDYPEVPPDNNASERAIRNVKVKMKVSGQFKTIEGAKCFVVIRSIIDTAKKNSQNIYDTISLLAQMPTPAE